MKNSFLYDFKRTITSKSVLVTVAVVILLGLAIIPFVKSSASPVPGLGAGTSEVLAYRSGDAYHFLGYSFNVYGQPLSGATYDASISSSTGNVSAKATTNSSGYAAFTLPAAQATSTLSLKASYPSITGSSTFKESLHDLEPGKPLSLTGNVFVPVVDSSNASKIDLLVAYEGVNGSSPAGYGVFYRFNSTAVQGFAVPVSPPTESEMQPLGQMTSFHTIFIMPRIPTTAQSIELALFTQDGTAVQDVSYPTSDFVATSVSIGAGELFAGFTAAILSIIVPLVAILVSYGSYGKDRVSGVLESVLVRPVTRRALGASRYLSTVAAMAAAIGITVLVMFALVWALIGQVPGWTTFVSYTFLSLVVEAAAFVGITMTLSHLMKSTGALIGVGVTLWVILDFFWGVIVLVVSYALGYGVGSANFLAVSIHSGFFNPAQFYLLVGEYLNGVFISTTGGNGLPSAPITPAAYGLTPATLAVAGAFWVAVPFALFLRIATTRD